MIYLGIDRIKKTEAQRRYSLRQRGINVPLVKKGPASRKGYAKMEFVCGCCNASFAAVNRPDSDPKKAKVRYCSRACYAENTKGTTNPNYKGDKPCRGCGSHIMGAQRSFCSQSCASSYYKRKAENRAPQERLNRNMRRAVTRFLSKGIKANRSWRSLTGFSSEELMSHLEAQFTDGMSWQNYGSYWHLDHIKPVVAFVFNSPEDQGFKDCWDLSNLQPLSAADNLKKNSNYNGTRIFRN